MFMQGLSERFSKAVSKVILCRNVGKKNTISRDILIADIKVFNFYHSQLGSPRSL